MSSSSSSSLVHLATTTASPQSCALGGDRSSTGSCNNSSSTTQKWLWVVAAKVTAVALVGVWRYYSTRRTEDEDDQDVAYDALKARVPPRSIAEFEQLAIGKELGPLAKVYFQFVCDAGTTGQGSRQYFQSIRLVPTILTGDVSRVDTSLTIFGRRLEIPVLVAPSAFHVLACPQGEIATARGTGAAGAGYCYNWMLSSKLYKDVVVEQGVKWLHLYMFEEKDLVKASIETAMATGAFSAVIVTCDHPHTRVQHRMMPYFTSADMPHANPNDPFFPNQAAMGFDDITLGELLDPHSSKLQNKTNPGGTNSSQLSWEDVRWIQSLVPPGTPIVAKGILSSADALKALEVGVNAIVVSNHGGRQCDIAIPAIEALPAIVDTVQGRIPIFVDSGIRSAGDIVKALCLGATGVMLGRPPLWALACGGGDALERMFRTLQLDLEADLRSLGVTDIRQLGRHHLWPPDRERIEQRNIVTQ